MSEYAVGDRGQYAVSPYKVPLKGWWQVLRRVAADTGQHNISIVAAGVAFFGFLSVFPGLIALAAVYGLATDAGDVQDHLATYEWLIPGEAYDLIAGRLGEITATGRANLGLGLLFSLVLALWSATKGVRALMKAMNIAYRESRKRNIVWENAIALSFSAGGIAFVILSLVLIAGVPAAVAVFDPQGIVRTLLMWTRWAVLAVLVLIALSVFYRFAPNRRPAQIRWITPGAGVACLLWLVLSAAFSIYVQNFGNYDRTFGSLGAVVVLLMWFYLSAFVVCLGAELNAELEYQTYRDSTVGPIHRAGRRGAYVADHTWEQSPDLNRRN